jgi:hypothetical protein
MVEVAGIEPASEGTPSPVLHAYRVVGSRSGTARRAERIPEPACEFNRGRQATVAAGSRDSDPTSTSTGTSGFGAYALSGESVVVVVGNYEFAAGFTRKAAPSACTR